MLISLFNVAVNQQKVASSSHCVNLVSIVRIAEHRTRNPGVMVSKLAQVRVPVNSEAKKYFVQSFLIDAVQEF